MKTKPQLLLAMLVGIALGISGAAAIYAQQAKAPPGYIVSEIDVKDPVMFQKYLEKVPETLVPFNGRFFIRGGKTLVVEGAPPQRFVVIAFDSFQKARDWEYSPAYEAIKPLRQNSSTSRIFIAEGAPPQ